MDPLDRTDLLLVAALDRDPGASTVALAAELGLGRATVAVRLQRLRERGVLRTPSARMDPRALGYALTAFLEISLAQGSSERTVDGLGRIPEIVELHATTGRGDHLARVVARDTADLHRITTEVTRIPGVLRTNTSVVLEESIPFRLAPLIARALDG